MVTLTYVQLFLLVFGFASAFLSIGLLIADHLATRRYARELKKKMDFMADIYEAESDQRAIYEFNRGARAVLRQQSRGLKAKEMSNGAVSVTYDDQVYARLTDDE